MKFDNVPNAYIFDNDTKEYKGTVPCDYDPEESKIQGKFVPLLGNCETLKPVPELEENQTAIFENENWVIKADYRGKKQAEKNTKFVSDITYIGDIKDGYQMLTDSEAESIQQTPDKWYLNENNKLIELTDEEYSTISLACAKENKQAQNSQLAELAEDKTAVINVKAINLDTKQPQLLTIEATEKNTNKIKRFVDVLAALESGQLPAELIPEGMLIDDKYLPWNTKDDVNILIGKQGAMVLFASMMAYNGVMWTSKYLQYKQQIEAATTIDELDLIEIDYSYSDKVIDISSLDIE